MNSLEVVYPYDLKLCRFLSADPYIQAPEYSQSYNRYSYCFNNPLAYVDPTGNFTEDKFGMLHHLIKWAMRNNQTSLAYNGNIYTFGQNGEVVENGFIYGTNTPYLGEPLRGGGGGSMYFLSPTYGSTWRANFVYQGTGVFRDGRSAVVMANNGNVAVYMNIPEEYFGIVGYDARVIKGYFIEMNRIAESPNATLSKFFAYGPIPLRSISGYMLEPKGPSTTLRGQDRRVPAGTYRVTPYSSSKYPNVYSISNAQVPLDRYILLHSGNYHSNTLGCLLPGSSFSLVRGDYAVWNSTTALNQIRSLLGMNTAILIISEF